MLDPLCAAQLLPACFNSHNLPLFFRSETVEFVSLNFIRDTESINRSASAEHLPMMCGRKAHST